MCWGEGGGAQRPSAMASLWQRPPPHPTRTQEFDATLLGMPLLQRQWLRLQYRVRCVVEHRCAPAALTPDPYTLAASSACPIAARCPHANATPSLRPASLDQLAHPAASSATSSWLPSWPTPWCWPWTMMACPRGGWRRPARGFLWRTPPGGGGIGARAAGHARHRLLPAAASRPAARRSRRGTAVRRASAARSAGLARKP